MYSHMDCTSCRCKANTSNRTNKHINRTKNAARTLLVLLLPGVTGALFIPTASVFLVFRAPSNFTVVIVMHVCGGGEKRKGRGIQMMRDIQVMQDV